MLEGLIPKDEDKRKLLEKFIPKFDPQEIRKIPWLQLLQKLKDKLKDKRDELKDKLKGKTEELKDKLKDKKEELKDKLKNIFT